jgi:hypothetical protein
MHKEKKKGGTNEEVCDRAHKRRSEGMDDNCSEVYIIWLIGCKLICSLCLCCLLTQSLGF